VGTQIAPVVRPLTPVYRRIGWRPCDRVDTKMADVDPTTSFTNLR